MKIYSKKKDWDSDFFKIEIAEAYIEDFDKKDYQSIKSKFISAKIELVYLYPMDNKSKVYLLELNVPLADNKIIYFKKLTENTIGCVEEVKPYEIDEHYSSLLNLALASGEYSRFKKDLNFRNNEFEKLYTTWLNKSLDKTIADDVLVWRDSKKEIKGFVTYKIKGKALNIGLIAVDTEVRGKGIGKNLLNCIEHIAINENVFEIIVETQQENIISCRFYENNLYKIKNKIPIFHLWLH